MQEDISINATNLRSAKSSIYNSIEIGTNTIGALQKQEESLNNVQDTLEANDFIIDKSIKTLRKMTWSGYIYETFNSIPEAITGGKQNNFSSSLIFQLL